MAGLDVFNILFCLLLLLYASVSDIRRRSVSNIPWLVIGLVGLGQAAFSVADSGIASLVQLLISVGSTFALSYLFFRFGLFGAADAKCLISIAALFPRYPSSVFPSFNFPILFSPGVEVFPFALTTLTNAAVLALLVPVFLGFRNLFDLRFPEFRVNLNLVFIGYRTTLDRIVKGQHIRLVHSYRVIDGKPRKHFVFGGVEINPTILEQLKSRQEQGQLGAYVWVTPELPFMIFITIGFLVAVFLGNPVVLAFVR